MQNKLTPILDELAMYCLETTERRESFTDIDLENAALIFMKVLQNKIFDLKESENIDLHTTCAMVVQCGKDFRQLIKTYTNIDMHEINK